MSYNQKLSDYGDLMTVEDFLSAVEDGMFIDYDGSGCPVKDGMIDNDVLILPSLCPECIPPDATHIEWYNR